MNAVIAAVGIMLILSLSRVHVVIALIVGALVGGLTGGLGIDATLKAFNNGLGGGATVALSYALLGAFAVAIAKSGLAHALADKALAMVDRQRANGGGNVKWLLIGLLWVVAIASQNIFADSYRLYSVAGSASSLCADQAATGPSIDCLCHHLWFDHAVHVPARGLRQHLPQ